MGLTFERSAYYLRMSSPNFDFVTPGEYLELEGKSEIRNEYIALREYVLLAQDKVRVEYSVREGEQWTLSEISDPGSILHLASVDCHVGLAAIYEKVDFNPVPIGP